MSQDLDVFAQARNWKSYFSETLHPFVQGNVLEVGAGLGTTMAALNRGGAASWTCLEPDPSLAARIPLQAVRPGAANVRVRLGTVGDLTADERFDTIVYIDVLEHIADDAGELALASGHLEPGGRVIVLSPAYQFLFSPFDGQIGHFRRYTRTTLSRVVPRDLEVERLFYLDALGAAASLANRLWLGHSLPSLRQVRFWDRVMVPLSRAIDPLLLRSVGRSVVGIFRKPAA
jgi:SAM-dependent methyltransferase